MNEKLYVPIAIIIAGIFIGGAVFVAERSVPRQTPIAVNNNSNPTMQAANMRPISLDDHILGNPNADLIIVEYSDTECPFCKNFHSTLHQAIRDYGKDGTVAWVYRHFPIADLHSKAPKEAEATECANDLGGPEVFWKYLNEVYDSTNSNNSLDPKQLPKIAEGIGLNVDDFNTCLSSGKFTAKVQTDYDDAVKTGGQGTPHTILVTKDGGKLPIEGATSYEGLKGTIDLLLKK